MPTYPDTLPVISTNIPPGGRKGQTLTKGSDLDYSVKWSSIGGGSGSCDCNPMSIIEIIKMMEENRNGNK